MNYIIKKIEKKVYIKKKRSNNNILLIIKKEKDLNYNLSLNYNDKLFFFNIKEKFFIKEYLKESGILK